KLLKKFDITKVRHVVPGGSTGQMSIFNGLEAASKIEGTNKEDIVIIHDGVRPLIDANIISDNIKSVRENGTAVTVKPVIE
ncbi:IspD/TarI family cytidylyltransferase, partial [Streptococcus pyogenes]